MVQSTILPRRELLRYGIRRFAGIDLEKEDETTPKPVTRMRVDHVFGIVKNIFGFVKVRKDQARNTKYWRPCEPLYGDKEFTERLRGVDLQRPTKTR